jgi:prepilin-type N-terminal cleavage/methylation domain-containing protein
MKQKLNMKIAGFTLSELILVMAIAAILMSIAIPKLGWKAMEKVHTKTTGQQFSDYLKLARSLAITHAGSNGAGYEVVLSTSKPYTYSLINADTSDVIKGPIALPTGVSHSGNRTYRFMPLGNLSGSQTLSVTFSKVGSTATVTVTPIGRITVQ